ncbi:9924_t:CDS:2 [Gigaspora rosea]|nr:9924_t:CDS:2 [Gigaspora rosea]
MTLKEFFGSIIDKISPSISIEVGDFEQIKSIEISQSIAQPINASQASPDCNIIELTNELGKNIHYHLSANELQSSNSYNDRNAFDIIMKSSTNKQLHVSIFKYSNPTRKQQLRLDMVEWIQSYKSNMRDGTKLHDQNFHIPQLFLGFFDRADPESYREARPLFCANELIIHCKLLIPFLTSLWIRSPNFNWLYTSNHESEVPIRSIEQATLVNIYEGNAWIDSCNKAKYRKLKDLLQSYLPWKPINLEEHLPNDPMQVYNLIH